MLYTSFVVTVSLTLPCLGRWEKSASFSARQIGFDDVNECPHLCTLAYDYLRKNKGYEDNIFAFFQNSGNPDPLIAKFIEELDKCILGYFSFHWNYATYIITQVTGEYKVYLLLSPSPS